jgi:hypothetical protein
MKKIVLVVLQACLATWLAASFSAIAQSPDPEKTNPVTFFDVAQLPVRVDEPKLGRNDKGFVLDGAVANRSGEQLMGIRLILLVIDSSGKLRSRTTWTERVEVAMYSIKTVTFHPEIEVEPRTADQIFLGIEEVFGQQTIWRASGAEKALRAYARGQHDVVPTVRTIVNSYDPRPGMSVLPPIRWQ